MGTSKSKNENSSMKTTAVDLSTLSARVDRVHISGLQRTWDDYVRRAVQNLFTAKTFEDVLQQSVQTKDNLTELGIFKSISVTIDVSKRKQQQQPSTSISSENGYEVTFNGVELSRVTGSIGTEIGQNEGAATIELSVPNIAGRGERLSVHGSYSNAKTTDMNIRATKPFYHTWLGNYKPETSISLFRTSGLHPWSKFSTNDTGVQAECAFWLPSTIIHHTLQYECAIREISTLGKRVPFFVREECGPKMSSLIRYACTYDQRDSAVLPTNGFYAKTTAELCGFGGNIAYNRLNTHAEWNVPLFSGISLQFCGRYGIIQRNKKSPNVPISQRFVLGGPFTIRGFQTGGACTQTDGAAIGNHSYWCCGAHIWSPLPFNRYFGALSNNLKLHAFASAGNVDDNFITIDMCRTSIGAGLAFRLGERARIELNYCKPIQRQPGDVANKEGFQFGIGYEFA